jgi:hypothetical protein
MIRKLSSGLYRLYSHKTSRKTGRRRLLGTFCSRQAAAWHELAVQLSNGSMSRSGVRDSRKR